MLLDKLNNKNDCKKVLDIDFGEQIIGKLSENLVKNITVTHMGNCIFKELDIKISQTEVCADEKIDY
jgi:hypothetical protein